jgi:F-type H+-transporting ATPase subunit epsilon
VSLQLEILVPDGVVLHESITGLQATDASGRFGVLPGHETFLTLLVPCVLFYRDAAGRERYAAADGGVLVVEGQRVVVVTREAVTAERVEEVAGAAAAMLEARRLREKTALTEFAELQTVLLRELREVQKRT